MSWTKLAFDALADIFEWLSSLPEEQREAAIAELKKRHAEAKSALAEFVSQTDADLSAAHSQLDKLVEEETKP